MKSHKGLKMNLATDSDGLYFCIYFFLFDDWMYFTHFINFFLQVLLD